MWSLGFGFCTSLGCIGLYFLWTCPFELKTSIESRVRTFHVLLLFKFKTWFNFFYSRKSCRNVNKASSGAWTFAVLFQRYKRAAKGDFWFGNQWRLGSWFNFKCITIIVTSFMWNLSHWGSMLNYDYAFWKLFVIIMKSYAWLL